MLTLLQAKCLLKDDDSEETRGHQGEVTAVSFSPDSSMLVSSGRDTR